jgi:hypothetical protein
MVKLTWSRYIEPSVTPPCKKTSPLNARPHAFDSSIWLSAKDENLHPLTEYLNIWRGRINLSKARLIIYKKPNPPPTGGSLSRWFTARPEIGDAISSPDLSR